MQPIWYPVAFVADLPPSAPYGFSIHGEPLVLFRDSAGRWACFADRCPHRAVRLSQGRVVGDRLECMYHGWQFTVRGECAHIPQWPADKPPPEAARLKGLAVQEAQGIVWVALGDEAQAEPGRLPTLEAWAQPDVFSVDYAVDLPYDQGYLIENVIDVAHIHIVHDGLRGGGRRELARPLEFSVLENSERGIRAQFRSVAGEQAGADMSALNSASVDFVAPNLIHYASHYKDPAKIAGLALYSLPLGPGRCRLLYRKYSNFYPLRERLKPVWLEHWTQNQILVQDMRLIVGQFEDTEASGQELKALWLPLKSLDTLVLLYRQWLDHHAGPKHDYRGWASHRSTAPHSRMGDGAGQGEKATRHDLMARHVRQCHACRQAYGRARRVRSVCVAALIVTLPGLLLLSAEARAFAAAAYALALLGAGVAEGFMRRFVPLGRLGEPGL